MFLGIFLSIALTLFMVAFSVAFKVAGKLRLTLPLVYFLAAVISTFFTRWTSEHESLVLLGLYILIGLCVLSWIVSLVKAIKRRSAPEALGDYTMWQIEKAREKGITQFRFNERGDLIDPKTGEPMNL